MARLFILLSFFLSLQKAAISQATPPATAVTLSEVLAAISPAKWRSDSLGVQGYRLSSFGEFEKSSPDTTSAQQLFSILDKPDDTVSWQDGTEYRYYLIDSDIYQRKKNFELPYLAFVVKKLNSRIIKIRRDYLCF